MGDCRACRRSLGLFDSGKRVCSEDGCDISDCKHCHRLLHECKECGDLFCDQHLTTHEHESSNLGQGGLGSADEYKKDLEESGDEPEEKPIEKVFTIFGAYGLLKVSDSIQEDMTNLDKLEREHGYVLVGQTEDYFIVHKEAKE